MDYSQISELFFHIRDSYASWIPATCFSILLFGVLSYNLWLRRFVIPLVDVFILGWYIPTAVALFLTFCELFLTLPEFSFFSGTWLICSLSARLWTRSVSWPGWFSVAYRAVSVFVLGEVKQFSVPGGTQSLRQHPCRHHRLIQHQRLHYPRSHRHRRRRLRIWRLLTRKLPLWRSSVTGGLRQFRFFVVSSRKSRYSTFAFTLLIQ